MTYRVLTSVPAAFKEHCPEMLHILQANDCDVIDTWYAEGLPRKELLAIMKDVDGAIIGLDMIDAEVLNVATRLKVVTKFGAGVDNFDIPALTARGTVLGNVPGVNSTAVAEFTIGLVLAISRRIVEADKACRQGRYNTLPGPELDGKVMGIIGLGRVGQKVARLAQAFGMRVIAYSPHVAANDPETAQELGVPLLSLKEVMKRSDIVSIHTSLTSHTQKMIGEKEMQMMKKTAYLINTARGAILDEEALYRMLKQGVIAGAALDVYSEEPPTGMPILELDNIVTTPHNASSGTEAIRAVGTIAAENVVRVLHGQKPIHAVNPEVCAGLAD